MARFDLSYSDVPNICELAGFVESYCLIWDNDGYYQTHRTDTNDRLFNEALRSDFYRYNKYGTYMLRLPLIHQINDDNGCVFLEIDRSGDVFLTKETYTFPEDYAKTIFKTFYKLIKNLVSKLLPPYYDIMINHTRDGWTFPRSYKGLRELVQHDWYELTKLSNRHCLDLTFFYNGTSYGGTSDPLTLPVVVPPYAKSNNNDWLLGKGFGVRTNNKAGLFVDATLFANPKQESWRYAFDYISLTLSYEPAVVVYLYKDGEFQTVCPTCGKIGTSEVVDSNYIVYSCCDKDEKCMIWHHDTLLEVLKKHLKCSKECYVGVGKAAIDLLTYEYTDWTGFTTKPSNVDWDVVCSDADHSWMTEFIHISPELARIARAIGFRIAVRNTPEGERVLITHADPIISANYTRYVSQYDRDSFTYMGTADISNKYSNWDVNNDFEVAVGKYAGIFFSVAELFSYDYRFESRQPKAGNPYYEEEEHLNLYPKLKLIHILYISARIRVGINLKKECLSYTVMRQAESDFQLLQGIAGALDYDASVAFISVVEKAAKGEMTGSLAEYLRFDLFKIFVLKDDTIESCGRFLLQKAAGVSKEDFGYEPYVFKRWR